MKKLLSHSILFIIISLMVASCYPTRSLQDDELLFIGNKTKIVQGEFKENEISYYYRHKTNKKVLGVRGYLMWYNFLSIFKDSVERGELPVIYDSLSVDETVQNIETYLHNEGYFNARVEPVISKGKLIHKNKTRKAQYQVYLGQDYIINDIKLEIKESVVRSFVQIDLTKSDIQKGRRFSVSKLKKERKRITTSMQNKGYFYFKEELISFNVDTNMAGNLLDLTFKVNQYKRRLENTDSIVSIPNRRFKVRNIYIYTDISATDIGPNTDTLVYKTVEYGDTTTHHFIYNQPLEVSAKAISRAIYIEQGIYKKSDATHTYKQLSILNNFKSINIGFQDVSTSLLGYGELDCIIELSREERYFTSVDFGAKNTGGDFGVELSGLISNRNTFRNAEILTISAHAAADMQSSTSSDLDSTTIIPFWERTTYEAGINATLDFPRLLGPDSWKKVFPRYWNPNTRISLGYNIQNRPDFYRTIVNGSFDWNWRPKISKKGTLKIINLSAVKINPSPTFEDKINSFSDPRIKYAYQNHLVSNMSLNYTYNTQQLRALKPYSFFSAKIEVGGAFLHGLHWVSDQVFDMPIDSLGQRLVPLTSLPYSNYLLFQFDYRRYVPTGKNVMNVFRAYVGAGFSGFWNSQALPFEKSFYTGGANSLRGWLLGTVGPGVYKANTTTFEKTGDIKIEFNYELRFPIAKSIELGLFIDAGNIWLQRPNSNFPDGDFKLQNFEFLKQFNTNFGAGFRYDLEFLIIRLDMALPLYQPYLPEGERWSIKNPDYARGIVADIFLNSSNEKANKVGRYIPVFNFAIGYPF